MKVLATYGIKGGVGKTTTAVNIAALAAADGLRTVLWDLDPQGAAGFLLKVKPKVKGGSLALLTGDKQLAGAARDTGVAGLDLLPADATMGGADLALDEAKKPERQLGRVLKTIRDDYDLAVLDCPPGLTLLSENVFRAADLLLVPLIPTPLSLRTYDQLLEFLAGVEDGTARVHPFFSMVDRRKSLHAQVRQDLLQRTTRPLTAWVPAASIVERMAVTRRPLVLSHPRSSVAVAYRDIWAELLGLLA